VKLIKLKEPKLCVQRKREREREREKKQRENKKKLKKKLPQKKLKKCPGTRVQGCGALVPWYQGSHLRVKVCANEQVVCKYGWISGSVGMGG
jgi:hypothetical protein